MTDKAKKHPLFKEHIEKATRFQLRKPTPNKTNWDKFYKLSSNENFKEKLIASEYIRSYAFTNDFELLAVILETFIETPQEFKRQFPKVYSKVKQMLNFNFSGY